MQPKIHRDPGMVVQAAELYRSGKNTEDALDLLENSTNQIDALVCTIEHQNLIDKHNIMHRQRCGAWSLFRYVVGESVYFTLLFF
jgi:hypothetical protein